VQNVSILINTFLKNSIISDRLLGGSFGASLLAALGFAQSPIG
jgi:hypothetical protein